MRTVLPIHAFKPFTPDVIDRMQACFTEAVAAVEQLIGGPAPDNVRERLALRIIDSAQRGVDASAWTDDAVEH